MKWCQWCCARWFYLTFLSASARWPGLLNGLAAKLGQRSCCSPDSSRWACVGLECSELKDLSCPAFTFWWALWTLLQLGQVCAWPGGGPTGVGPPQVCTAPSLQAERPLLPQAPWAQGLLSLAAWGRPATSLAICGGLAHPCSLGWLFHDSAARGCRLPSSHTRPQFSPQTALGAPVVARGEDSLCWLLPQPWQEATCTCPSVPAFVLERSQTGLQGPGGGGSRCLHTRT